MTMKPESLEVRLNQTFTMTGKGYGDLLILIPVILIPMGSRTYKFVGEGAYDSIELSDELKEK